MNFKPKINKYDLKDWGIISNLEYESYGGKFLIPFAIKVMKEFLTVIGSEYANVFFNGGLVIDFPCGGDICGAPISIEVTSKQFSKLVIDCCSNYGQEDRELVIDQFKAIIAKISSLPDD